MAMALKRPFPFPEYREDHEIIDLTSDTEEEPSSKRQRSAPPSNFVDLTEQQNQSQSANISIQSKQSHPQISATSKDLSVFSSTKSRADLPNKNHSTNSRLTNDGNITGRREAPFQSGLKGSVTREDVINGEVLQKRSNASPPSAKPKFRKTSEEQETLYPESRLPSSEPLISSTSTVPIPSSSFSTQPSRPVGGPRSPQTAFQAITSVEEDARPGKRIHYDETIATLKTKEVSVPFRPSPSRPAATSSQSLEVKSLSKSNTYKPSIIVNIPTPPWKSKVAKQNEDTQEIRNGVDQTRNKVDRVHSISVGSTFSDIDATDLDRDLYQRAAPTKLRDIDRSKIDLGLGVSAKTKKGTKEGSVGDIIHPREQVKAIFADRFSKSTVPPITFSKNIHDRHLGKFQFVSDYVFRKGIRKKDKEPPNARRCSCVDCNIACECLSKDLQDHIGTGTEQVRSYRRRSDGLVVLSDEYIDRWAARVEILECNEHCRCSADCENRMVQKGRTVPLEIFETERCGWGVRALKDLVRGQFIDLYLGEVIIEAELQRREEAKEEGTHSYVLSLDWFANQSSIVYHIDATNFGSAMRFVNHSCRPNAKTFTIMNPSGSKQLHRVGFFAVADIPAGKEITIDYDPNAEREDDPVMDEEGVVRCMCGEANCRKRLWKKTKTRRPRKKLFGRELDD